MLVFLLGVNNHLSNENSHSVKQLKLLDKRIEYLLASMKIGEKERHNLRTGVYVVKVQKTDNYYELKLGVIFKDDFQWYLKDKRDKLLGYFEFNKRNVLVFGAYAPSLFSTLASAKSFDFLNLKMQNEQVDSAAIKPPPIIFEPEVKVYHITSRKIILHKKGLLNLLE